MDCELSSCLRTATLIEVLPIVASAFVQSQQQPADSLHSLWVCRSHVNAVSMNLFPHIYKCGNVRTCQKVRMVHQLSLISSLQYILSNKAAESSKLVQQMRGRSILQLTLQT